MSTSCRRRILARYIAVDPDDDPVFNCDSQSIVAKGLESCLASIDDDLDEPESENMDTGETSSKRTDGALQKQYKIFKQVHNGHLLPTA